MNAWRGELWGSLAGRAAFIAVAMDDERTDKMAANDAARHHAGRKCRLMVCLGSSRWQPIRRLVRFMALHRHRYRQHQAIWQLPMAANNLVKKKTRQPPITVHERVGKHKTKAHQRTPHKGVDATVCAVGHVHEVIHLSWTHFGGKLCCMHMPACAYSLHDVVLGKSKTWRVSATYANGSLP